MDAVNHDANRAMRGGDVQQLEMFSYESVEKRVPADHPIRKLRLVVETILMDLDRFQSPRRIRH